jgi:ATP-binding cassette subfamily F protein uup
VKALSGGERNRLLLARLFTRPANVLVLDEPTNDLDLETLELLEAQLVAWPGTLLLVSHDRVFLDHVVTSVLVFESAREQGSESSRANGHIQEYVGGYEDWLRQRPAPEEARGAARGGETRTATDERRERSTPRTASRPSSPEGAEPRRKLSYRERQELDGWPARIEALEDEQRRLHEAIADPAFYRRPAEEIQASLARVTTLEEELTEAYTRWTELDSRQ